MIHGLRLRRFGLMGVMSIAFALGVVWPEAITSHVRADDTELTSADESIDAAVLTLHGMITDVMVDSLRRRFDDAQAGGAKVIVLDMEF